MYVCSKCPDAFTPAGSAGVVVKATLVTDRTSPTSHQIKPPHSQQVAARQAATGSDCGSDATALMASMPVALKLMSPQLFSSPEDVADYGLALQVRLM